MAPPVPDLVRLSKLETQFHEDPEYTQHVTYVAGNKSERKRIPKEERWRRKKRLGQGGFGTVWLEQCFLGDSTGELRAVKEISKKGAAEYNRELEAIALFSNTRFSDPKFEHCFVNSFGWYENDEDIILTMEYFPNGDLHRYTGSPLPESEVQCIVAQILEGLQSMHENDFAHRDLKPQNILVAQPGPAWWVKITDFGISKRAIDGLTGLRTETGTRAFAAPEVFGILDGAITSERAYTNAVDIWSVSVITYLLLTGEMLFKDTSRLKAFASGAFQIPLEKLLVNNVSQQGCDFVHNLMRPKPRDRPGVAECQKDSWLHESVGNPIAERVHIPSNATSVVSVAPEQQPSARWTTQEQTNSQVHGNADPRLPQTAVHWESQFGIALTDALFFGSERRSFLLVEHAKRITCLAFAPDGKQLASGSEDTQIMLWERSNTPPILWKRVEILQGHSSGVRSVRYSPDGTMLASRSDDHDLRVWSLNAPRPSSSMLLCPYAQSILTMAFSPDGNQLASSSGLALDLWDSKRGTLLFKLSVYATQLYVAYSPDGTQLASIATGAVVDLWDPRKGKLIRRLTLASPVNGILYSPDGKQLVSGADNELWVWNPINGQLLCRITRVLNRVKPMSYSPDGRLLVASFRDPGGEPRICLWDTSTWVSRGILNCRPLGTPYAHCTFSMDGNNFITCFHHNGVTGFEKWDVSNGAQLQEVEVPRGVQFWRISPDGNEVVAGYGNGRIRSTFFSA